MKQPIQIDKSKLEAILGQELKYKQLCEALDLKPTSGNAKTAQLKQIDLYCNLEILSKPTRYKVTEVYDKALIRQFSQFQVPLEILLFRLFQANGFKTLYLTNGRLLEGMKLVNSNYNAMKNPAIKSKVDKMIYDGAQKSGEILIKWLRRAIEKMEKYGYLMMRHGYCLLQKIDIGDTTITKTIQVPLDSDLERKVMECQRQAYKDLGLTYNDHRKWIPNEYKERYFKLFNGIITGYFSGRYCGGYQVNVLTPNEIGIKEVLKEYECENIVNQESQRKIRSTSQLDWMTESERNQLIQDIISRPMTIDYYSLI